jgi:hypothetical protein
MQKCTSHSGPISSPLSCGFGFIFIDLQLAMDRRLKLHLGTQFLKFQNFFFFAKIFLYIFSDRFDVLISKMILKK